MASFPLTQHHGAVDDGPTQPAPMQIVQPPEIRDNAAGELADAPLFEDMIPEGQHGPTETLVPKTVDEGVAMTVGYGPDGHSAQVSWGEEPPFRTDRQLMQLTILKGRACIKAKDVCDSVRRFVPNPHVG
eukprot:8635542-Karenia_brevis.AAC.1